MSDQPHLPGLIRVFDKLLTWLSLIFGGIALVFMTGFTVWNVLIMRKLMNAPITGAEDILILVLVAVVALSIALGARSGEPHVRQLCQGFDDCDEAVGYCAVADHGLAALACRGECCQIW